MLFLDRETSQKLVDRGLKSESGFAYVEISGKWHGPFHGAPIETKFPVTPAFTLSDFLEGEQGVENCKKLWPTPAHEEKLKPHFGEMLQTMTEYNQLKLVNSDWREIVRKAVE